MCCYSVDWPLTPIRSCGGYGICLGARWSQPGRLPPRGEASCAGFTTISTAYVSEIRKDRVIVCLKHSLIPNNYPVEQFTACLNDSSKVANNVAT